MPNNVCASTQRSACMSTTLQFLIQNKTLFTEHIPFVEAYFRGQDSVV